MSTGVIHTTVRHSILSKSSYGYPAKRQTHALYSKLTWQVNKKYASQFRTLQSNFKTVLIQRN